MALPKALVRIPIAGISSKESELLVEPGSLATLDNCTLDAAGPGGATAAKRLGFTQLTGTLIPSGSVTSADGLATFGDELIRFDGSTAYAYVDGGNAAISKGVVSPCIVTSRLMVADSTEQQFSDMAIANDYAVVAWVTSSIAYAQVFDAVSWKPLEPPQSLGTATRIRAVAIGNYLHVVKRNAATLTGFYFDTTAADPTVAEPSGPPGYTITAAVAGQGHFDVIAQTSTRAAYCYTSAADTISVGYINQLGVVSVAPAEVAVVDGATINFPTLYTDSTDTRVSVLYWRDNAGAAEGLKAFSRVASDLTADQAPTMLANASGAGLDVRVITATRSGTILTVFYSGTVANVATNGVLTWDSDVGTVGSGGALPAYARIASRAFSQDSVSYVVLQTCRLTSTTVVADSLRSTFYLVRWDPYDYDIVATALTGRAGEIDSVVPQMAASISQSGSTWTFAASTKTRLVSTGDNVFSRTGISRVTFDFASSRLYQSASAGAALHTVGGQMSSYDGIGFSEVNFHTMPEGVTAVEANLGAGSIANGTYSYRVVQEYTDANGNICRGTPSVAVSVTVAAGPSDVTVTVPEDGITARRSSARLARQDYVLAVYRTTAGGTAYYRTSSVTSPTYNGSVVTDTTTDANLVGREILYTTGGVLENTSVPACSVIAAGKNRLFLAGIDDDPNIVWYSKEYVKGEAISFSDALTMRVDPTSIAAPDGEITGLAVMDSSLLVFLENCVVAIAGDGPTDSGEQNTFGAPQLVTSDTGCSDARSICITPAGVMFKGAKGIYLLTRGMQVQYIGAPVEAYNSLTLTSAVLIEGKNQVRITHSDGVALCHDYYTGQWSTFSNHAALDAVMWNGSYTYLRTSGGTVYREAASTWTDPSSTSITMTVVTPWIKTAGIAGFQRLRRLIVLGTYYAAHTLRVRIAYDYSSSYSDTYDYVTSSDADVATRYECRVHVEQQKCESFRVELTDVSPSGTQRSATWSAIVAECGVKQGPAKMPAAKSI